MKYIYGPVKSRRLGRSLGISLTPYKVCSFDCVYCQLGHTTQKTIQRKEYVKIEDILRELKELLRGVKPIKRNLAYITFSGFGEPALNSGIGFLIKKIKEFTDVPVAVLTNSSFVSDKKSRKQLLGADLVVPSLDAVTEDVFKKIDRPVSSIKIKGIIKGLICFRKEYKGRIYLEIMLVKGINDSLKYAKKFKKIIDLIRPDAVQLNTPVRNTAEGWVRAPKRERLLKIRKILGENCQIV